MCVLGVVVWQQERTNMQTDVAKVCRYSVCVAYVTGKKCTQRYPTLDSAAVPSNENVCSHYQSPAGCGGWWCFGVVAACVWHVVWCGVWLKGTGWLLYTVL